MSKESGVDKNLYQEYKFEDHMWHSNNNNSITVKSLLELCEFMVSVNGDYWIYNPKMERWNMFKETPKAKQEAKNTLIGIRLKSGSIIDEQLLETYFTGYQHGINPKNNALLKLHDYIGSCPQLEGSMTIPLGPKFVVYENKRYLNAWRESSIQGDEEHIKLGGAVLRMIYRSLCSGAQLDEDPNHEIDLLMKQIVTGEYSNDDFKFVIHWLAALVQYPGINLLTNLWFIGEVEGNGKGTLISIMKLILGTSYVGQLNKSEIENRGWSDHLISKQLIEVNEFSSTGKFDWLSWIKSNCNEITVTISQRGKTAYEVINTANYIFAMNPRENLLNFGANNRRDHILRTSRDKRWVAYASNIRGVLTERPRNLAAGFAFILEKVNVNKRFINRSFINDVKKEVISKQINPITWWITQDSTVLINTRYSATDLYIKYTEWGKLYLGSDRPMSIQAWGHHMKGNPYINFEEQRNKMYYTVKNPDPESAIEWDNVAREFESIVGSIGIDAPSDHEIDHAGIPMLTPLEKLREALRRHDLD